MKDIKKEMSKMHVKATITNASKYILRCDFHISDNPNGQCLVTKLIQEEQINFMNGSGKQKKNNFYQNSH